MSNTEAHDYTKGSPRRHHSLYIEEGDIVLQVQNAIFKVHQYFLAKYSTVIRDMLQAPRESGPDGTDENPLILSGDSPESWQYFLEAIYDNHPIKSAQTQSGDSVLAILSIAHKYCMESVETAIIDQLKKATTTPEYVDLMVASRIVDSELLYQQALQGLIATSPKPNLIQARRIGVDAHHAVIEAAMTALSAALANTITIGECPRCAIKCRPWCSYHGVVD